MDVTRTLFDNYNKKLRPVSVEEPTTGIRVDVAIAPFYVDDLN